MLNHGVPLGVVLDGEKVSHMSVEQRGKCKI